MIRLLPFITFLMMIGSQVTAANEDSSPSTGYLKYVCNGETHIIVSTEAGWASPSRPNVTVETTYDGFMLTDRETGLKRSLGKSASGADVMYVYYADGTKRYDCVSTRVETLPANVEGKAGFVIRGLYLGMPVEEFRTSFEREGYTCDWSHSYLIYCKKGDSGLEWANMGFNEDKLATSFTLRCGATNSCRFKVDEIVSILKAAVRFPNNTIEVETVQDTPGVIHRRMFSYPNGKMSIWCDDYGSYNNCDIGIDNRSLHPNF